MDVGDLYANTATGELRRYSGSAWVTAFGGIPNDGTVTTAKLSTAVRDGMIGKVGHFARNTAPTGWLKANGAAVSRTTYADLFSKMGILFGAGDGSTTFNVPDLRGEWIRGWDDARGVDVGRAFGSSQAEMIGPHPHPIRASVSGYTGGNPAVLYAAGDNNGNTQVPGGGATYGVQNNSGTENRVRNVALLACIQF
ncbi:MAG: tail fiber protein [Ensifer sp. SSB1]|nr:tail fiber protein [Ensifer sp. SSB1]